MTGPISGFDSTVGSKSIKNWRAELVSVLRAYRKIKKEPRSARMKLGQWCVDRATFIVSRRLKSLTTATCNYAHAGYRNYVWIR